MAGSRGRRFQCGSDDFQRSHEFAPTARGAERDSNGVGRGLIDAEWIGRDDGELLSLNIRSKFRDDPIALQREPNRLSGQARAPDRERVPAQVKTLE
jgi:hypothetical protein